MVKRGSVTLFANIFEEPVLTPVNSASLRQKKIDCIIDFYYYTGRKTDYKYSRLLETVSHTFFLSPFTLHDIIQGNLDKLTLLKQEFKDRPVEKLQKEMVKKWPHLVW